MTSKPGTNDDRRVELIDLPFVAVLDARNERVGS
jgi:hypothetical protein